LETFLWGFGGSAAVEVVTVYHHFTAESEQLPGRYKSGLFWVIRLLLAIVAGGLAVGYGIQDRLLAANIGAATPLIIQALAQGLKPTGIDFQPTRRTRSKTRSRMNSGDE
jgi:hypothetical protein